MGTGWSLAFFAAAAVLAASLATAALAGELCRLPVRRIAAVSTIAALLLICGEVLALFSLGRPELIFGILANPSTGLFREFAAACAAAAALLGLVWARRRCALRRTCLLFAAVAALLALGAVASVGTVLSRRMAYRNDGTAIVRTCLSRHCIGPPAALRRRSNVI